MDQGKVMGTSTKIVKQLHWLWVAILLYCCAQVAVWFADRAPPFRYSTYASEAVKPGNVTRIVAKVERDLNRECSVVFSRHLIDQSGARFDLVSGQSMSANDLRTMDALMPGELRLALLVPESTAPWLAHMFTTLQYTCNPIHRLFWPISTTMELDFIVTPP